MSQVKTFVGHANPLGEEEGVRNQSVGPRLSRVISVTKPQVLVASCDCETDIKFLRASAGGTMGVVDVHH